MRKRIEHKTSMTAQIMCLLRASSFYENDPCLKTNDYIAPRLLPKGILPFARIKMLRTAFIKYFTPPGAYEYVIVRTKFIDSIVEDALEADFAQIVLLGAGFDSRAIRFYQTDSKAVFFELDAAITQARKVAQLKNRKIAPHENTVYIPIDFNKEDLTEKLKKHGFETNKKSLFILEGITMYLEEAAVRRMFAALRSLSAQHSLIVSDFIYKSVLRKENTLFGEQAIYKRINKYNEAWRFGIEEGYIDTFMKELGLRLQKSSSAKDLEEEYHFGNRRINGTHFIAVAETP
jgi:methyltransferase (TIGR00027 family)